ncbi:MAG: 4Fe-4S cluster-binding domain-containing protein [Candidatus Pacearchaeota archaeon]|nr:4Fe-4S cluster-binding domain-containing protein [Candidatus Pacearchaeota archaeon]
MEIKKTKFDSYCLNGIAEGCKYCVKGEKLVLFVTGICKRNCWYCSLSNKRKNKDVIFANERKCKNIKELFEEVKESRATSAGITGGDPLLFLPRTIKFASELKKRFGKEFHIHIYLPTKFVTAEKLEKLSKVVDEVRFHPEFLINKNTINEDVKKISLAGLFWNKPNIGIELPLLPDKKEEVVNFILKIKDYIGFVNLNEFELSDTNFNIITKNYNLNRGGYVAKGSLEAGRWILDELRRKKVNLKVHLCTAELKNQHQFRNRLKKHKFLPYGKRTEDGTVIYLIVKKKLRGKRKFYDKRKNRTILSEDVARKLLEKPGKYKIIRVEEFPTYDRIEVESGEI